MTQDSIITDEMKKAVGVESEPSVYVIQQEPIRRWADSIGDPNPLYHDEEYAKSKGYRSIIAPPGFLGNYAFPLEEGKLKASFESPFTQNLNGGNEYELYKPVQAGDVITATTKYSDIHEREGRLGKMLIVIRETIYKNQDGEVVAKARHTGISY